MAENNKNEILKSPDNQENIKNIENRRRSLYHSNDEREMFAFHDQMANFANLVERKFTNCRKYKFFHILIGSTGYETIKDLISEDFPGDYSIEKFLELPGINERQKLINGLKKDFENDK